MYYIPKYNDYEMFSLILGGASLKSDEQCHLDKNGYYSEAAVYDYPSIAQVYRLLDKYKVNRTIFVDTD